MEGSGVVVGLIVVGVVGVVLMVVGATVVFTRAFPGVTRKTSSYYIYMYNSDE